jgi:hypothetical protein
MSVTKTYKEQLDRMKCSTPGCTSQHCALYLSPACHPGAPLSVLYEAGTLTIECHECRGFVDRIAVAGSPPN